MGRFDAYFLQNDGVTNMIKAKISRRPASIRKDIVHFPAAGTKSYEPVTPVTPAPRPLLDAQEIEEKKASTIGKSKAESNTPPTIIKAVYINIKAAISLEFSGLMIWLLILTAFMLLGDTARFISTMKFFTM